MNYITFSFQSKLKILKSSWSFLTISELVITTGKSKQMKVKNSSLGLGQIPKHHHSIQQFIGIRKVRIPLSSIAIY